MPRQPDAEGFKFSVGETITVKEFYAREGIYLNAKTTGMILSRTKSQARNGAPMYQVRVSGEGHFYPVYEEAFEDN